MTSAAVNVEGPKVQAKDSTTLTAGNFKEKLHHSLRLCITAAKKAKHFEVQRAIRRIKSATDDEKHTLQSDLQELKNVDHKCIGAIALRAKLIKAGILPRDDHKGALISSSPPCLVSFAAELDSTSASTKENVNLSASHGKAQSRLLSNRALSIEVSAAIDGIEKALGKAKTKKLVVESSKVDPSQEYDSRALELKEGSHDSPEETSQANSLSTVDEGPDHDKQESHKSPSGPKINSVATAEAKPMTKKRKFDDESRKSIDRNVKASKLVELEDASTASLPVLSTGFVGGRGFNLAEDNEDDDEDDEWSDGDADLDSIDEEADMTGSRREIRKNRMGQRARRAIWEKKFGKGANHLKMLEREPKRRDSMRRPRDSTSASDGRQRHASKPNSDAGWSGALAEAKPTIHMTSSASKFDQESRVEKDMHPSWIAKQKQRQRQEAILGAGTKVAKKIVFD